MKTMVLSAGALATLLLVVSAIDSRETQAKAGNPTPVTVMNTKTNPAIVNADGGGRTPYQSSASCQPSNPIKGCTASFPVVPKGSRLFVQDVSGTVTYSGTANAPVALSLTGGSNNGAVMIPVTSFFQIGGPSNYFGMYHQPVSYVVDGGQTPGVGYGDVFIIAAVQAYITGYLLDCNIASCPAVAGGQ